MLRTAVAVASALVLAATGAGCGGDDGPDPLAGGDDLSVEAALAELPRPPEAEDDTAIGVNVIDLDAASEANGAERPEAGADDEAVQEWWAAVSGSGEGADGQPIPVPPIDAIGLGRTRVAAIRDELGIPVAGIATAAQVSAPPFTFAVIVGDVGEDDLAGADLEDLGEGAFSAGSGEDLEASAVDATDVRRTGAPLRLAADDDRIAASSTTEELEAWRAGEGGSLADDDAWRGVAAALDDHDVVSAALLGADFGRPAGAPEDASVARDLGPEAVPIEEPFTVAGVGFGVEDGEPVVTVAYAFADGGAADDAADQVEAAYADALSLRTLSPISAALEVEEVEADGRIVVARLQVVSGPPGLVMTMLSTHDTPFFHR